MRLPAPLLATLLCVSLAACGEAGPVLQNREEVADALTEAYPAELEAQGLGGQVMVTGMVKWDGSFQVETIAPVGSTDPRFAEAAREVAARMRFMPARVGPMPVSVRISLPVTFEPAGDEGSPAT